MLSLQTSFDLTLDPICINDAQEQSTAPQRPMHRHSRNIRRTQSMPEHLSSQQGPGHVTSQIQQGQGMGFPPSALLQEVASKQGVSALPGLQHSSADFECSICSDIVYLPVVGPCGHDFCLSCIRKWFEASSKQRGQLGENSSATFHCPICRMELPGNLGVCHRLKSVMEFCFPEQLERRKQEQDIQAAEAKQQGASKSILCKHLSLVHAPNPVTFEAAVQEQQQQRRRRRQQQLELQHLSAELNSVLSPDLMTMGMFAVAPADPYHGLSEAGGYMEQPEQQQQRESLAEEHSSIAETRSLFAEVQRGLPPRPNSSGSTSEGRRLASWLASDQSRQGRSASREHHTVVDMPEVMTTHSSQPSSAAADSAATRQRTHAAEGGTHKHVSWSCCHTRSNSEEMGNNRRWASLGAAAGESLMPEGMSIDHQPPLCTAHSNTSSMGGGGGYEAWGTHSQAGVGGVNMTAATLSPSEGLSSLQAYQPHSRAASHASQSSVSHRDSDGGTSQMYTITLLDSDGPMSTLSNALAPPFDSRCSCSACNSSQAAAVGGGGASMTGALGGSGGPSGMCGGSPAPQQQQQQQQQLYDAVGRGLLRGGSGSDWGGYNSSNGSYHRPHSQHHTGTDASAGDLTELTSSMESLHGGGGREPDGLPGTPRAGGHQAAQAANHFFGSFSPLYSGGTSPAGSGCGGSRRAQSPAQGSYGPGSYPASPGQPRSPASGSSPTHSRTPTVASGSPFAAGISASAFNTLAPQPARATSLNSHLTSNNPMHTPPHAQSRNLAAWGLWSPHSSLAHASAAHAHHPLAHIPSREHPHHTPQPPFPLSTLQPRNDKLTATFHASQGNTMWGASRQQKQNSAPQSPPPGLLSSRGCHGNSKMYHPTSTPQSPRRQSLPDRATVDPQPFLASTTVSAETPGSSAHASGNAGGVRLGGLSSSNRGSILLNMEVGSRDPEPVRTRGGAALSRGPVASAANREVKGGSGPLPSMRDLGIEGE